MTVFFLSVVEASVWVEFLAPTTLLTILLSGLSKSALYVMIASGLTLIFGLMGVLNFTHGSLTMIGSYLGGLFMVLLVSQATGQGLRLVLFFIGIACVCGLLTFLGSLMEMTLIRPLYSRPPIYQILLTFGLTLVLDELVRIIVLFNGMQPLTEWQSAFATKPVFLTRTVHLGNLSVSALSLFEIGFGVLTVLAVAWFLQGTRFGLYVRAGSEDAEITEALGINVQRVFTVVFGLGAGITGAAGMLLMWDPKWGASVPLSVETLLPAFVIVIIGGLGTFQGTVVAAVIVGMTDALMTWWFQNAIDFTGLPEMMIFLILVGVLIVQPRGLFGVEGMGGH